MRKNEKIKVNMKMNEYRAHPYFICTSDELKLVDEDNQVYMYDKRDSAYVHSCGIVLALCTTIAFGNDKSCKTIICDDGFDKLPKFVQRFLVLHEIGHCVNGDDKLSANERKKIIVQRSFGNLPEIEVNADKYAYSIMGEKAKKALLFLLKKTDLSLISKLEIRKRIKRIDR